MNININLLKELAGIYGPASNEKLIRDRDERLDLLGRLR